MSKGTRFLTLAIPLLLLYILALYHIIPTPLLPTKLADDILPVLPWWLLVSFGAYSLTSLGLGLVRFHDCPEAYESLLSEISQARDELRNAGVAVD
ncbi:dolichyl-phosphate mannosyltransferase polypeptide 3 [Cryptococcus neoformans]|uniref:Dolichol-phosphate mannosyltransferase subunit 3 n=2 Tax=Cryptococcus neoformans TaxID=5207 RepID=A0A854QJP8_CRYNE|nr:dolichyl-phosphate mannosyltransferase polypeptide 3 [Cryptococcus neoformans var. grubii H99]AUB21996.1 dolichyl-phosphate mannosyltransferase polypeptide 3 [Cryptococcus neoformans var. grubii]OWT37619.1 dolichyl-phosphate mannosyltransferase polypeptide 3 [Cryptococcus neoformans var. grubii Bt1]OWZ36340.1 dolichyl-phosphate mannosyltransferase polypeptide 3 [Cryptococcus neoformans var. grubii AD2-60a]OWZ48007.1 dolichyl-phosphate mannosyltransferase polypeptide 3 [Cryptococcus neoforman|eukprot:XP_012046706.1 dolichyl-phosphate mannosyltransferase polypeptide 3 [Cryptococcus neoformans var. grubii H99]